MISNFSFVANTQSLTKDSVGKNEDAYLLMIVDQLQRTVDDHNIDMTFLKNRLMIYYGLKDWVMWLILIR